MADLLENLNDQQKAAVTHRDGPLLIVAGAGTGKTTVITKRIAWLIEQGLAKPENILALTFTDKAAGEMEERVDRLLPLGYVELSISTFHAFCEKLLREYAVDIGLSRDFRVVTELDGWLLARRYLDRFDLDYYRPLGNPTKFLRSLLSHFCRAKDSGISPLQYLTFSDNQTADQDETGSRDPAYTTEVARIVELGKAYHTYQQLLLENDALDFGDLFMMTLTLLRDRPKILETLRRRFTYILVDEFQDTNTVQYEIVKLIAAPKNNLTVVGDDDQSVYAFRGASLANILQFESDYPDTARVVLTHNYRSVQQILDHAHTFIQKNNPNRLEAQGKLDKKLVSQTADVGVVGHIHLPTLDDETEAVAQKILELKTMHLDASWNDFAILTRSNDAAIPFLSALERNRIPYQFMAMRGLYTKPVILDLIAYLRVLVTPHDSPSMYRVLTHPMRNIPPLAISELSQFANRKGKSLFDVCATVATIRTLNEDAAIAVQDLVSETASFRTDIAGKKVGELFVRVAREAGFVDYLNKRPEQEKVEAFRYLQQFYERLKRFESTHEHPVLAIFFDEFEQERAAGEEGSLSFDPDAGPEMARVMTVHGSKGLEFRFVFIVSMIDQRFPSVARSEAIPLPEGLTQTTNERLPTPTSPTSDWHLEEERRLFYVAMTRAKEQVYFTSADDYGGTRKRKLSRFLTELGFEKPVGRDITKTDPFLDPKDDHYSQLPTTNPQPPIIHLPKQFSFTQLTAFRTCPLQYKFAHVLKIPVFGKWTFSFGKTMHNTLHRFFVTWLEQTSQRQHSLFPDTSGAWGRSDGAPIAHSERPAKSGPSEDDGVARSSGPHVTGLPVSIDGLLKTYADCWQDDWYIDDKQREEYRARGREQLKGFYAYLKEHPAQPKYLEQDFTLKIGEVILKGRIDRIDEFENGVEIIDYKTGTPKELDKIDKQDKEQLYLYQIAARDILGLNPVKLTYHYLENNSQVSFIGDEDDLIDLKEKILERVEGIKKSNFTATPGFHCGYCDFADICEFRKA